MERNEVIEALLDCDECPFEQEQLEAMSGETLHAVALAREIEMGDDVTPEALAKPDDADGGETATDDGDEPGDGDAAGETNVTPEAVANALGIEVDELDDVGEVVRNARETVERERREIVQRLLANERCQMTESTLDDVSLEALKELEASFDQRFYGARGGPRNRHRDGDGDGESYFDRHPRTPSIVTRNVQKEKRDDADAD